MLCIRCCHAEATEKGQLCLKCAKPVSGVIISDRHCLLCACPLPKPVPRDEEPFCEECMKPCSG
jgi:hypothetical protein